ncbi:MAG TPA: hypothetical protein VER33_01750, partial [Polyangiaceae bacterium]|nr:hypothetical protein [Polyangiaceae bacterium]
CQHGARCTNTATSYECECSVGYSGRNCEINVDDCAANPCKNGGTCRDGVASHTCACPTGFFGLTCSAGFSALPFPSSTDNYAVATGVSGNGLVVVGWSQGTNLSPRAFRWTSAGSRSLGLLADGTSSKAFGVSADGAVVVGEAEASDTIVGFRWADNQMTSLGLLEFGSVSHATAVSGDGTVIVGYGDNDSEPKALRWQNGAIGTISSVDSFEAHAVSGDGTVIAGHGGGAVRYTAGVATWLDSPAAITSVKVSGLSANGRVIVGWGQRGAVQNALRWTDGVPENLGVAATDSTALATNRDGSIIVGTLRSEAMLWDAAGGMRPLSTVLTGLGVELAGFSALASATGVSANGKVVVGFGRRGARTEAWIARLP